jgi:parallel beta-helix repeat protein
MSGLRTFLAATQSAGSTRKKAKHVPSPTPSPVWSPSPSPTAEPSTSQSPDPTPSTSTGPSPTPTSCSGVDIPSGGNIQDAIDAHGSGTTFCLSGTYSASSLAPKSNDVFIGGTLKGNGAPHAFSSSASGVTLDGIEITGYNPGHYNGAVDINGSGWTVRNCYIHHNAGGAGVVWANTTGTKILNNKLLYNGEEGFASTSDTGTLFSGNEVGWNNTSHQDWNDEAGGGKFYKSTNLTVTNNYSHDNDGPGLWCDTNCYKIVFDGNRLVNNTAAGIDYEISYDAVIRNNTLSGNGTYHSSSPYYGSAGILVETSQNVEVYGNSSSRDGNGIVLLEESRGTGNRGTYMVQNVSVHDNNVRSPVLQAAGLFNELSDSSYWSTKGNSFVNNDYWGPSGSREFSWNGSDLTWSGWQSAGQDRTGSYTAS